MGVIYRNGVAYGGSGGGSGGTAPVMKSSITFSSNWSGSDESWSQAVTIPGYTITPNSKIDLQPTSEVLSTLFSAGCNALYVENNNGTLTAHLVGTPPSAQVTIQCTITELFGEGSVTGADLIAPAYSSNQTYAVNDYCIYGGYLYRCTTAIPVPEAFDQSKWSIDYVGTQLTAWLNIPNVSEVSY